MGTKTKTFGCVAVKDRIQARLVAKCERRKDEFPPYMAFIQAAAAESDWVQRLRARRARGDGETSSVKT